MVWLYFNTRKKEPVHKLTPRKVRTTTFMHESGYGQITLSDSPASIRYLGKTLKAWREGYLNQSWAEISRCCGGSPCGTTIKNLENGVTMKPHYLTVMSLLQALGFKTVTTHESHASRKTTRQLRKVA